jgi:hypothetical protein
MIFNALKGRGITWRHDVCMRRERCAQTLLARASQELTATTRDEFVFWKHGDSRMRSDVTQPSTFAEFLLMLPEVLFQSSSSPVGIK